MHSRILPPLILKLGPDRIGDILLDAASEVTGIHPGVIKSRDRTRDVAFARMMVMVWPVNHAGMSHEVAANFAARLFDRERVDRSTIGKAVKRMAKLLDPTEVKVMQEFELKSNQWLREAAETEINEIH